MTCDNAQAEQDGSHTSVTVVVHIDHAHKHRAALANLLHLWTTSSSSNLCDTFVVRCHQEVDSIQIQRLKQLPQGLVLSLLTCTSDASLQPVLLGSSSHKQAICEGNVELNAQQLQQEGDIFWDAVEAGGAAEDKSHQSGAADGTVGAEPVTKVHRKGQKLQRQVKKALGTRRHKLKLAKAAHGGTVRQGKRAKHAQQPVNIIHVIIDSNNLPQKVHRKIVYSAGTGGGSSTGGGTEGLLDGKEPEDLSNQGSQQATEEGGGELEEGFK